MTENGVVELPETMVVEVGEVLAKEVSPIILARVLEIEIVKEIEIVTEIEQLAKIKTKVINVLVVHLLAVAYRLTPPEQSNVRVVL